MDPRYDEGWRQPGKGQERDGEEAQKAALAGGKLERPNGGELPAPQRPGGPERMQYGRASRRRSFARLDPHEQALPPGSARPEPWPALKEDVGGQLAERRRRKEVEHTLRQREEEEESRRIMQEAAAKMQADLEAQKKAKEDLKNLLLSNEENRKAKLAAKERMREEEVTYMKKHAEMLDKHEQERREKLEAAKRWQQQRAATAATLPPTKQWIDPAIIETTIKAKEAAAQVALAKSAVAKKEARQQFTAGLAQQIEAKKANRTAAALEVQAERVLLEQQLKVIPAVTPLLIPRSAAQACVSKFCTCAEQKQQKPPPLRKKLAFKQSLDEQVQQSESRSANLAMSPTEHKDQQQPA
eukprot:jgi/Botrbrau1/15418/Bobra.43_2s0044.1